MVRQQEVDDIEAKLRQEDKVEGHENIWASMSLVIDAGLSP